MGVKKFTFKELPRLGQVGQHEEVSTLCFLAEDLRQRSTPRTLKQSKPLFLITVVHHTLARWCKDVLVVTDNDGAKSLSPASALTPLLSISAC